MFSSRKIFAILILITIACTGVVILASRRESGHPGGDPGARILALLKPTASAIPNDARIAYRHNIEPLWDSCDGQAGTFGWSDVVMQVHFRTSTKPREVFAHAASVLARQGWMPGRVSEPDGPGLRSDWTKRSPSALSVSLSNNTPDTAWDLYASAAPLGRRASGC